ncbi:hypothetical protein CMUS01_10092 [Colletotrichum musicola]|uniref:Uncharacterized protein n=1 Tax=Colletotrichum musicola TaxID=2175873 RepID=A0A8H6N958_9PEZI|nr:hypothetical protein CMUS01_10092 [Colletotrichum musicola]
MSPNMRDDGWHYLWVLFCTGIAIMALVHTVSYIYSILPPVETFFYSVAVTAIVIHTLPVFPWLYLILLDPVVADIFPCLGLSPESAKAVRDQSALYSVTNLLPYWNGSVSIVVGFLRFLASRFHNIMFDFDNSVLNFAPIGPLVHWFRSLRTIKGNEMSPQNNDTALVLSNSIVVKLSEYDHWCKEPQMYCQRRAIANDRLQRENAKLQEDNAVLMKDFNKIVREIESLEENHEDELAAKQKKIVSTASAHQFWGTIHEERRFRKAAEKELSDAKKELVLYQPQAQQFAELKAEIKDRDVTIQKMQAAIKEAEGTARSAWRHTDEEKRRCDAMIEKSRETVILKDAKCRDKVNEAHGQVTLYRRALDGEKAKLNKLEKECARLKQLQSAGSESQSLRGSQRANDHIRQLKEEIQTLQGTSQKVAEQHQNEIQSLSQHANDEIRQLKDELHCLQKTHEEVIQKQESERQSLSESQRANDENEILRLGADLYSLNDTNKKLVREQQREIQSLSQRAKEEARRLKEEIKRVKDSKSAKDSQSSNEEVQQLNEEIQSLRDTNTKLVQDTQSAKKEAKSVQDDEIRRLKKQIKHFQDSKSLKDLQSFGEIRQLKEEIQSLRDTNTKLVQNTQTAKTEVASVQNSAHTNNDICLLKNEIQSLQETNKMIYQECHVAKQEAASLQQAQKKIAEEHQSAMSMVKSLQETNQKIAHEQQGAQDEIASLNQKLVDERQAAQSEIVSLNQKIAQDQQTAQNEITSLNQKISQEHQMAQNEIASLNQKIALEQQSTKNGIDSMTQKTAQDQESAMSAIQSLQDANRNLTQEKEQAMHAMQSLQEANQRTTNEHRNAMNEVQSLKYRILKEHEIAKATIERLQQDATESMRKSFQRAGEEVQQLKADNQEILLQSKIHCDRVEKENKTLRVGLERMGIKNEALQEHNAIIQSQLNRLRGHTDELLERIKEERERRRRERRRRSPSSATSDVSMESEEDPDEDEETDVDDFYNEDEEEDEDELVLSDNEELRDLVRWMEGELEEELEGEDGAEEDGVEDRAQAAATGQKETFIFTPEASPAAPANPFTGPVQPPPATLTAEDFKDALANLPGPPAQRPIAQFKRRLPKKEQEAPAQRTKAPVTPGTARKAPATSAGVLKKAEEAVPATPQPQKQKKPLTRRVHFTPEVKKEEAKGEPVRMDPESRQELESVGEKTPPMFIGSSNTPFQQPFVGEAGR